MRPAGEDHRVVGVTCLAVALLLAFVALSLGGRSQKVFVGYDTEILFVGDNDYYAAHRFGDLTGSGWEIKSSRRAWAERDDYRSLFPDGKEWGTEYTLQKTNYAEKRKVNPIVVIIGIVSLVAFIVGFKLLEENLRECMRIGRRKCMRFAHQYRLPILVVASVVLLVALVPITKSLREHNSKHLRRFAAASHLFQDTTGTPNSVTSASPAITAEPKITEKIVTDVPPSAVTNDLDVARAVVEQPHKAGDTETNGKVDQVGNEMSQTLDNAVVEQAPTHSEPKQTATPVKSETPQEARRLAPEGTVYNVVQLDFTTVKGKEYKDAIVTRLEPDGIVVRTKVGISKIYFTELPREVQERFQYDPANAARFNATTQAGVAESNAKAQQEADAKEKAMAKQRRHR